MFSGRRLLPQGLAAEGGRYQSVGGAGGRCSDSVRPRRCLLAHQSDDLCRGRFSFPWRTRQHTRYRVRRRPRVRARLHTVAVAGDPGEAFVF